MGNDLTNRFSANASANGYEFEYAAALLIYLENMRNVLNFGVEKKDDIYLELKNGEKVYAQAKSSLEADAIAKEHLNEIIESLRTLSENNDDAKKLISIFNFFRPFGDNDSFAHETNFDIKCFGQLTTDVKNKLKERAKGKYQIDFDKLEFWFFRFEGNDKLNNLKAYLGQKLSSISMNSSLCTDSIIQAWMYMIMNNAGSKQFLISSDKMVGVLFSKILERENFESILEYLDLRDNLGIEDIDSLKNKYNNFIDISSLNFILYNKIKSSYVEYRNINRTMQVKEATIYFINLYSSQKEIQDIMLPLFDEFDSKKRSELGLYMGKIFVGFSCLKANVIKIVSEVFGYEN